MSEVMTSEPVTAYMDILERVFAQDKDKRFLFLYSEFDNNGVRTIETGQEWLTTELLQGYDTSSEDAALIERFIIYWDVGGFIKIKVDDRNAVIVRVK